MSYSNTMEFATWILSAWPAWALGESISSKQLRLSTKYKDELESQIIKNPCYTKEIMHEVPLLYDSPVQEVNTL